MKALSTAICVFLALVSMANSVSVAQCQKCGNASNEVDNEGVVCEKVCRLVCETRKVEFTCWKSDFEDFCVPMPSEQCAECTIDACNCKEGADGCGKVFKFGLWQPTCAKVKSARHLYRKTVVREIPSYRWIVEARCHQCLNNCIPATSLPAAYQKQLNGAKLVDISAAKPELLVELMPNRFDASILTEEVELPEVVQGESVNDNDAETPAINAETWELSHPKTIGSDSHSSRNRTSSYIEDVEVIELPPIVIPEVTKLAPVESASAQDASTGRPSTTSSSRAQKPSASKDVQRPSISTANSARRRK
jgi:hypothetical protein